MTSKQHEMEVDKKYFRYAWESLELRCEWQGCSVVESKIPEFLTHITGHLETLKEEDFSCKWHDCGVTLTDPDETCRHIYFHAFHTKIKCYGKNVMLRKKLPSCIIDSQNRNIIPDLPDKLLCCWDICEEAYNNPELFYRHVDAHAENNPKGNNLKEALCCHWQGCSRNFNSLYKLRDHLRTHTQEKPMACPNCGGMFASRTRFVDHLQRQMPLQDSAASEYVCEYCSRKFTTVRLLRDHMRQHVNHYKCPLCDMTCPAPSALETHITYRHSSERPYSCQFCDYKCKARSDLNQHLETHNPEAEKVCPLCNYTSKTASCFNRHIRRAHGGEKCDCYMCHICAKTFTRGYHLTKHLIKVHRFHWPSGHMRFRYHRHADGYLKLQTVRYESIELSESMMRQEVENDQDREEQIGDDETNSSNDSSTVPSVPKIDITEVQRPTGESLAVDSTPSGNFSAVFTSLQGVPFILSDPADETKAQVSSKEPSLQVVNAGVDSESQKTNSSGIDGVSVVLWDLEQIPAQNGQAEIQLIDQEGNSVVLVQVDQVISADSAQQTGSVNSMATVQDISLDASETVKA